MSDIANKKLGYTVEANFSDAGKAIRELMGVFKTLDKTFKDVGNNFKQLVGGMKSDTQSLEKPVQQLNTNMITGFKEVVGELKQMSAAFQAVKANFAGGSKDIEKSVQGINQAFKSTSQQLTDIRKQIRQYGMNDLEKQADNYTSSIKRSKDEVEKLKKVLAETKLEDSERIKLAQKLTDAQSNLNKLQTASKQYLAMQNAAAKQSKGISFGEIDKNTVSTLNQVKDKLEQISRINRQSGMSQWQKQADDYRVSINQSVSQVDQLKKSLGQANITTKERLAIQKQIAAAEQDISRLTQETNKHVTQLKNTEMAAAKAEKDRLASSMDLKNMRTELASSMASFGLVAGAISGALTMSIRGVMKEFGEFEHQMKIFEAVSQSTAEELELVEGKVKAIGASTQFTATEVAAAAVELSKMGFSAQEVEQSLDGMVSASIASGEGLAQTSEIIATTIRTFGMAASDATKVADIIARGANISGQSFSSYAQSMKYLGSAAAAANQDLVDVSGMLAILADRGLKFSVAGNGMQNALLRLQAPTTAGAEALERFNIALANTQGTADKADDTLRPMMDILKDLKKEFASKGINTIEQAGILKDLFGEVALNSMQVFMSTSNEVMDSVMEKQRDYAGSSKETADKIGESFESGVLRMQSAISALQISIGEQLAPTMSMLADTVGGVANAFESMPKPIQSAGAHLALFLAGATAVFAGVGGISFLLNQALTGFGSLNTMMGGKLANTAKTVFPNIGKLVRLLISGPFLEIIAVAGGIYLAFKTNLGNIQTIFGEFGLFLEDTLGWWGDLFSGVFGSMSKYFSLSMKTISNQFLTVLGMFDHSAGAFLKMLGNLSRAMRAMIQGEYAWALTESQNAITSLNEMFDIFAINDKTVERFREKASKKFFGEYSWEKDNRQLKEATEKEIARMKAKRGQVDAQTDLNAAVVAGAGYADAGLDKENKKLAALKDQLAVKESQFELQLKELENEEKRQKLADSHDHGGGGQIGLGASGGIQTSGYGPRTHPVTGQKGKMHTGVDHGLPMGAPIKSDAAGKIAFSGSAGGYGNTIIVDAGDGNYILYGHASKLYKKVGDSVKKGEAVGAVGSTGTSTAPHLHSEIRKGAAGLVGAAAFGAAPINPSQGFNQTNTPTGTTGSPVDTAAKRAAIESAKYQALLQYQKGVAAILPTITKGTEQYTQAQTDLSDALKKVKDQEGVLLDLKINAKELQAKMVDDQLKSIKASFDAIGDEPLKAMEGFTQKFEELKKKQDDSTKSIQEIQSAETVAELEQVLETARMFESIIGGLKARIEQFKASNKTLTADQKKELAALEKQYASIDTFLASVGKKGVEYFNSSAIEGAQSDWDAMADSILLAGKAKIEFFKNLTDNENALKDLNDQVNSGAVDIEELGLQYKLSAAEMKNLVNLLAGVEFERQFNESVEKTRDASKQAVDDFRNVVDGIQRGLAMVSNFIYSFNTEVSAFASRTIDQVSQLGAGIADVFSGRADGFFRIAEAGFDIIASSIQRAREEAILLREELLRVAVAQGQSEKVALQRKLFEAEQRGAKPDEIKGINTQIAKEDTNTALKELWADFQSRVNFNSGFMQSQVDEQGFPTVFKDMLSQFNSEDPALQAYYKKFAKDMGMSQSMIEEFAYLVEQVRLENDRALATLSETEKTKGELLASQDEKNKRIFDYFKTKSDQQTVSLEAKDIIEQYAGKDQSIADAIGQEAQSLAAERRGIISELVSVFADDPEKLAAEFKIVMDEFNKKIADKMNAAVVDARQKALEAAQKLAEQELANAKKALDDGIENLKKARLELYNQQKAPLEALINSERQRLDQIEKQNKAIEDQIRLKNKQRNSELSQFDAQDQVKFAAMVSGVDYDAALNQGLDDIHNRDGVLTGTYSDLSHKEAIDERIALMALENENKLKLEQQTQAEYLAGQQKIAALQARFADEALQADDLTTRQRLELEQMKADAYVSFQKAYRDSINERFDSETSALQRSIDNNNDYKATIESNIASHQSKINDLTASYDSSLSIIDGRINAITKANQGWIVSVDSLKKGVEGPLNQIIALYEKAKAAAESMASSGSGGSGGGSSYSGGSYNPYGSSVVPAKPAYNPYGSSVIPAMAGGGVVPDGFPNDSFLTRLQSKEWVLPEWITKGLTQQFLNPQTMGGGRSYEFNLYGDFRDPGSMEREVVNIVNRLDRNGDSGYNGAFQSSLN